MENGAGRASIVEHVAPGDFAATVERIAGAITKAGLEVFARVDHAAAARGVGLAMAPATVLIYGHPKNGTPIMQATPEAALDLPLRVLIRERPDGRTVIAFHPIAQALGAVGVPADLAKRLEPAQQLLVNALAPKA